MAMKRTTEGVLYLPQTRRRTSCVSSGCSCKSTKRKLLNNELLDGESWARDTCWDGLLQMRSLCQGGGNAVFGGEVCAEV